MISPMAAKPLPKKRRNSSGVMSRTGTPRWFRIAASAVAADIGLDVAAQEGRGRRAAVADR